MGSLFETVAVTTLLLASIKFSSSLKAYGSSSSSLDVVVEVAARRPRPPNGVVRLPFKALDFGGGFVPVRDVDRVEATSDLASISLPLSSTVVLLVVVLSFF